MRATRVSKGYSGMYIQHFLQGVFSSSIEYELQLVERLLPGIAIEEIDRLADVFLQQAGRTIWVSGPSGAGSEPPSEADLLAAIESGLRQPVVAYIDPLGDQELISVLPQPGSIVSETYREDVEVTTWQLSNGGRIVVRPTDFRDDEVSFSAFSWGGTSQVEYDEWRSARDAVGIVESSGLAELDAVSLGELLSDKRAFVNPYIGPYSEGLNGSASAQDLETLVQLIYLYFSAPRDDDDAFATYIRQLGVSVEDYLRDPFSLFGIQVLKSISGGHPRAEQHTPQSVGTIDHDIALDFYRARFADFDDFTLYFVGDIDLDELRPLVEFYLAGLPSLPGSEEPRDLQVTRPAGVVRDVVRAGSEEQSVVNLTFHGRYDWSFENNIRLNALAQVLDIVLNEEIREDLGGAYSISASSNESRLPNEEYFVRINFGGDPQRIDELIERVLEVIADLRDGEVKEEWVTRVRNTRLNEYRVALENNNFWIGNLQNLDQNELDYGLLFDLDDRYAELTPQIIATAARTYLDPGRYLQVVLLPETE